MDQVRREVLDKDHLNFDEMYIRDCPHLRSTRERREKNLTFFCYRKSFTLGTIIPCSFIHNQRPET